jgi:hypothetical protein
VGLHPLQSNKTTETIANADADTKTNAMADGGPDNALGRG